jgi:hypothetical protein
MLRTTRLACTLLTLAVLACCGGDPVTHHPSDSISQKPLFWEIHPSHQILEARVRTEIVKTGINLRIYYFWDDFSQQAAVASMPAHRRTDAS